MSSPGNVYVTLTFESMAFKIWTIARPGVLSISGSFGSSPFSGSVPVVIEFARFLWLWRDDIFADVIGLSSATVTEFASKAVEFGEKWKIRPITPFQVTQGHRGRYQSKSRICDFLLLININWHRISYVSESSQLIDQILDTLRFWATL